MIASKSICEDFVAKHIAKSWLEFDYERWKTILDTVGPGEFAGFGLSDEGEMGYLLPGNIRRDGSKWEEDYSAGGGVMLSNDISSQRRVVAAVVATKRRSDVIVRAHRIILGFSYPELFRPMIHRASGVHGSYAAAWAATASAVMGAKGRTPGVP